MTRWIRTMMEILSLRVQVFLCSSLALSYSVTTLTAGRRRRLFACKVKKRKTNLLAFREVSLKKIIKKMVDPEPPILPITFPLPLTPHPPLPPLFLRRSTGTGRSSRCASLGARLPACGLSCASAWRTERGSTPGRWCIGRATLRCGCAGAWSWLSNPWISGGTACTRMASHLRRIKSGVR